MIRTVARWTLVAFMSTIVMIAASAALAQTGTVRDCIAPNTCTVVSDDLPTLPPGSRIPTHCRLYDGTTMLAEQAVTAPYACSFTRSYPAGTYTLTARYRDATGEGDPSNTITLVSAIPLPAPLNFRFP
mgnify:CR=1 FL=1